MKKYQVVIQFPEDFFSDFDKMVEFEEKIINALPRTHDFDGHDIGSGTINFFIFSNSPNAVLTNFRKYLGTNKVEKKVRIAFRETEDEDFENLWPKKDNREFKYHY